MSKMQPGKTALQTAMAGRSPQMDADADPRTPTIEAVKALDGRIYAMLDASELETLEFYRARGRKLGVSVTIINQADPAALAAAKSCQEADHIMKSANSLISVTVQ